MSDELARIAAALERLADHFAPPPEPAWISARCSRCNGFATGPCEYVRSWSTSHHAETGHQVYQVETNDLAVRPSTHN